MTGTRRYNRQSVNVCYYAIYVVEGLNRNQSSAIAPFRSLMLGASVEEVITKRSAHATLLIAYG